MGMFAKVKRGRWGNYTTQKMELYETVVWEWKPLASAAKSSTLDVAEFLDPSLINFFCLKFA